MRPESIEILAMIQQDLRYTFRHLARGSVYFSAITMGFHMLSQLHWRVKPTDLGHVKNPTHQSTPAGIPKDMGHTTPALCFSRLFDRRDLWADGYTPDIPWLLLTSRHPKQQQTPLDSATSSRHQNIPKPPNKYQKYQKVRALKFHSGFLIWWLYHLFGGSTVRWSQAPNMRTGHLLPGELRAYGAFGRRSGWLGGLPNPNGGEIYRESTICYRESTI